MGWKSNVMIVASVVALGMGVLSYTDPLKDTTTSNDQKTQQQVGDLSDNQENVHDRLRHDGDQLQDSDHRDRIGYSDPRSPEKIPHLRIRLLP